MAAPSLSDIKTLVNAVIDASLISQDAPFVPDVDDITGLVIKIGKQFMLSSNFESDLPELEGDRLEFGSTIEEYYVKLAAIAAFKPSAGTLHADVDVDGTPTDIWESDIGKPHRPDFATVVYSYELAKYQAAQTVDYHKIEHAMIGQNEFSKLIADITKSLYDTIAIYKYMIKKQLLGRAIDLIGAEGAGNAQRVKIAAPVDTSTGEAFVKSVKQYVNKFTKIHDTYNLLKVPVKSQLEDLVLYILEGYEEVIDVGVLAGAFNVGKVSIPVTVKTVEDFGTLAVNTTAYAILADTRGIKVHTLHETASQEDVGRSEYITYFLNYQPVCHISKAVNMVCFVPA